MKSLIIFVAAALFEIAGCFAFWMVLRQHKSAWWLGLGVGSLLVFASLLTRPDVALAGRTYAAYGGIYIVCSLGWLVLVEKELPDRWDLMGAFLCLLGALITLLGPRGTR